MNIFMRCFHSLYRELKGQKLKPQKYDYLYGMQFVFKRNMYQGLRVLALEYGKLQEGFIFRRNKETYAWEIKRWNRYGWRSDLTAIEEVELDHAFYAKDKIAKIYYEKTPQ